MSFAPFPFQGKTLISGKRSFQLDRPKLMGILNYTPNSFSDGGVFFNLEKAVEHAKKMIQDGADWLDIGGESTGPNSPDVSLEEELGRVIPLIQAIRQFSDIWISVDTWKAEVARQALDAGADVINDVTAFRGDAEMVDLVSERQVPVVMMFSKDLNARTTTSEQDYEDVVGTIKDFFRERIQFAESKGVNSSQLILDPGMGFFISGKAKYSFEVIRRISEFHELGLPIMLGPSRKSFMAKVTPGRTLTTSERDFPCAAVSSIALWQGVSVLRFHEVLQGRMLIDTIGVLGGQSGE